MNTQVNTLAWYLEHLALLLQESTEINEKDSSTYTPVVELMGVLAAAIYQQTEVDAG